MPREDARFVGDEASLLMQCVTLAYRNRRCGDAVRAKAYAPAIAAFLEAIKDDLAAALAAQRGQM